MNFLPFIQSGSTVIVSYPKKETEKIGVVNSFPITENGIEYYWVNFGHVSYTVPREELQVIQYPYWMVSYNFTRAR